MNVFCYWYFIKIRNHIPILVGVTSVYLYRNFMIGGVSASVLWLDVCVERSYSTAALFSVVIHFLSRTARPSLGGVFC